MRLACLSLCLLLLACQAPRDRKQPSTTASAPLAQPLAATLPALDSGAAHLLPVDQADSSFRSFRIQLLDALSRRDTTFLYSILAPEIKNSFGGDDSIAGFRRMWRPDSAGSGIWHSLARALSLGGKLSDSSFVAPYVYAFFPDSIDAFVSVAVTRRNAVVRADTSSTANAIGTTSYAILKNTFQSERWTHVALPNGGSGWLSANDVYSPVGWRAFFQYRAGRWQLVTFVAGD